MMEKIQNSPSLMLSNPTPKAAKAESPQTQATNGAGSEAGAAEAQSADFSVQLSAASQESQSSDDDSTIAAEAEALKKKTTKAKGNSETDAQALNGALIPPALAQANAAKSGASAQSAALNQSAVKSQSSRASAAEEQTGVKKINASTQHGLEELAEMSPKTSQAAASVNTAQAIAGLKPWSKNWVFEGADENPQLKGLFDSASPAVTDGAPEIAKAPSQNEGVRGMPGPKGETLGAQPAKKNLETPNGAIRLGEAGIDASLLAALAGLNGEIQEVGGTDQFSAGARPLAKGAPMRGMSQGSVRALGPSGEDFISLRGGESFAQGSPVALAPAGARAQRMDSPAEKAAFEEKQFWEGPGSQGLGNNSFGQNDPRLATGLGAEPSLAGFGPNPLPMDQQPRQNPLAFNANAPVMNLSGQVTQGSMARNRLSTETLVGMTGGIRSLSQQGGGEMKIRLKPDNLGELEVRVYTRGNSVGLKFQASDAKVKKVIEDSLGYLKDNMAAQNLSLAKIEVGVASPNNQNSAGNMFNNGNDQNNGFGQFRDQQSGFNPQQQSQTQWGSGQNESGERRGNRVAESDESDRVSGLRSSARAAGMAGAQRMSASGANGSGQRLNLLA